MEDKINRADYELRLYITGRSGRSACAVRNLVRIYKEYPHESYRFEIVDLLDKPELAIVDNIIAIPTLMIKDRKGAKRLVGDLSNIDRVVKWLGLQKIKNPIIKNSEDISPPVVAS